MLPRTSRLSTEQLLAVMEKGRVTHSPLFLMRSMGGMRSTRLAAIAPKKVAKTAVERNRMRRIIYEAASLHFKSIALGSYVALFAKEAAVKVTLKAMAEDLHNLFVKAGVMK